MGHRGVKIGMALKAALKRKIKEKKRMKELIRTVLEKAKECEMLKRKNQSLLANEAAKQKLIHDFMLFLEAIDNKNGGVKNDPKFDEKAMKNTILTMMIGGGGYGGHNGGFSAGDAKKEA